MKYAHAVSFFTSFSLLLGFCVASAAGQSGEVAPQAAPVEQQVSPQAETPTDTPEAIPIALCQCIGDTHSEMVAKIRQVLGQPLQSAGLQFQEQPLEQVVEYLRDEYKIPVQLDIRALEDTGIASDDPISASLQNCSLKSALRILLADLELTYIIRNETLVITGRDHAEDGMVTCVYDIRGLEDLYHCHQIGSGADYDILIGVLTTCIQPKSWAENGGRRGDLRRVRPSVLVVYQSYAVQEEIAELLTTIRAMRGVAANSPGAAAADREKSVVVPSGGQQSSVPVDPNPFE